MSPPPPVYNYHLVSDIHSHQLPCRFTSPTTTSSVPPPQPSFTTVWIVAALTSVVVLLLHSSAPLLLPVPTLFVEAVVGTELQCLPDLTTKTTTDGDTTGSITLMGCFSSSSTDTTIPYFTPKDYDFAEFMFDKYGSIASDINESSFLASSSALPAGYVGSATSADYYLQDIVNGYQFSQTSGYRATWIQPPYFPDVPVYPPNTPSTPSDPELLKVRNSCAAYCYSKYLDPVLLPYTTSKQTIQFILAYGRCSCIKPSVGRYVSIGNGHSYDCCKPMTSTPYPSAIGNATNAINYDDISSPDAEGLIRPNMCSERLTYGVVYEMEMDCPLNASYCDYHQGSCGLKALSTDESKRCCLSSSITTAESSFTAAQQVAQWLVALIVFAVVGQFIYWMLRVRRRRQQQVREEHLAEEAANRLLVAGAAGQGFDVAGVVPGGQDGNQIDHNVGVLPPLEAFEREMQQRNRIAQKDGIELLLVPGVLMGPPAVVTVWLRNKKDAEAAALEAAKVLPYAEVDEIDPEECCPMCTDELTELVDEAVVDVASPSSIGSPLLVAPMISPSSNGGVEMGGKATPETNVIRLVCNHMIHRACMMDYMAFSLKSYLCTIACPICRATALVQQQAIKQQRLRKELYHFRKMAESEVLRLVEIGAKAIPPRRGYKRGSIVFFDDTPAITELPFRAFIKPVPDDKIGERVPVTKTEVMLLRREVIETLRQQTMHSVLESLARSDTRDQFRAQRQQMPGDNSTRRKLDKEVLSRLTNGDRELLDSMETKVARIQFGDDVQPSIRWRSESLVGSNGPSVLLAALPGSRSTSEDSEEGFRFAEAIIDAQSSSHAHTTTSFREAPSPNGSAPRRTYSPPSPPAQDPVLTSDDDDDEVPLTNAGVGLQRDTPPRRPGGNNGGLTAAQLDAAQGDEGHVRRRNRDGITSTAGFAQAADVAEDELPLPDDGSTSSDEVDDELPPAARSKPSRKRRVEKVEEQPLPSPRSGVVLTQAKSRRRGRSAHRGVEGIPQPINRSKRSQSKARRLRATTPPLHQPTPTGNDVPIGAQAASASPQSRRTLPIANGTANPHTMSSLESLDMGEDGEMALPPPQATTANAQSGVRGDAVVVPMDDDEEVLQPPPQRRR